MDRQIDRHEATALPHFLLCMCRVIQWKRRGGHGMQREPEDAAVDDEAGKVKIGYGWNIFRCHLKDQGKYGTAWTKEIIP